MKKKEAVKELIVKARRSLEVVKNLSSAGHYDFSVSRAYYVMFYCAEALLFSKGLSFSKHSAVIAAFGKEFIKRDLLPKEFHKYLMEAFEDRLEGDYEIGLKTTKEQSVETIKREEEFLTETKKYLKIE